MALPLAALRCNWQISSPFLPDSAQSVAIRLKGSVDAHGPMRDFDKVIARATLTR